MGYRTDLAFESAQMVRSGAEKIYGIEESERNYGDLELKIRTVNIKNSEAGEKIGKPKGKYVSIISENGFDYHGEDYYSVAKIISEEISSLLGEYESVMAVGLGNREITSDGFGTAAADRILATRHIKTYAPHLYKNTLCEVTVTTPGVMGKTGIETAQAVEAMSRELDPSCIAVFDSLACGELSHLGKAIQLTDSGISPGSGVKNARKELSYGTLGKKVVAIGVPTVIDMYTIAQRLSGHEVKSGEYKSVTVTPKDIDTVINRLGKLCAIAFNHACQPQLSFHEIEMLT